MNKKDEKIIEDVQEGTEDKEDKEDKEGLELEECRKKVEEVENIAKRALADYQNLQKRVVEERKEWIRSSNKELVMKLLPVLDTLILASSHVEDQGLKLSIKQFEDILKQEGAERIRTIGEKFDPIKMECIQVIGVPEEQDGIVVEETRAGYVLYDKVLRPAQVIVGQRKMKVTNIPSGVEEGE